MGSNIKILQIKTIMRDIRVFKFKICKVKPKDLWFFSMFIIILLRKNKNQKIRY